ERCPAHASRPQGAVRGQLLAHVGRRVEQDPALAVRAHRHGRLRAAGALLPRRAAVGTATIPLGESATCGGAEDDDAHREKRGRDRARPPKLGCSTRRGYALPAYAPTSMPSSTTSNSGFVHDMLQPPRLVVVDHSTTTFPSRRRAIPNGNRQHRGLTV